NNLTLRRASREISSATTLTDLFVGIEAIVAVGEFVGAVAELTSNRQSEVNQLALERALTGAPTDPTLRNGRIQWRCYRNGFRDLDDKAFWTLRLPLTNDGENVGHLNLYRRCDDDLVMFDLTYLTSVVQPAMAQAATRIFSTLARESAPTVTERSKARAAAE